jgi:hypothetical protein
LSQPYSATEEVRPRSSCVRRYDDGNKEDCGDYVDEVIPDDDTGGDIVDEFEEKMADDPVLMHDTQTLPPVMSLPQARNVLLAAVEGLQSNAPVLSSGIVRFQVQNQNFILHRYRFGFAELVNLSITMVHFSA